jgi:hypothetical protein
MAYRSHGRADLHGVLDLLAALRPAAVLAVLLLELSISFLANRRHLPLLKLAHAS